MQVENSVMLLFIGVMVIYILHKPPIVVIKYANSQVPNENCISKLCLN
jgi:hypothetical protein